LQEIEEESVLSLRPSSAFNESFSEFIEMNKIFNKFHNFLLIRYK